MLLDNLRVAEPSDDPPFSDGFRDHYEHHSRHLCDEPDHDPYTGLAFSPEKCDVDHIVAAKEAHVSGGTAWAEARRNEFGNYPLNLVASRDCVNRSKSNHDIARWTGVKGGFCGPAELTPAGACFLAARTIKVKTDFDLAIDAAERDTLIRVLSDCPTDIDPNADSATPDLPAPESS